MRILVCGGGIAGLTLASCLAQPGHQVLVVERAGRVRDDGYMIDFFGSGYVAAERLHLLPRLERIHYPVSNLTFVDPQGRETLSLPYPALRRRLFDDRHFNFMRGELERVLYETVDGRVEIRFGTTVDTLEQHGAQVSAKLTDGTSVRCDLLVGADGVHSHIRQIAFDPEPHYVRDLGCHTAAYIIADPPRQLRGLNAFVTLTVPGRQVAVYPLRDGRLATFFVHRDARAVVAESRTAAVRELRDVYGDLGWVVPALLDRAAAASSLYLDAVVQIEMPTWTRGRVVLLGDACGCVSLLAGQGASLAVAGAVILAEELEAAINVPAALARYEARLKTSVARKQAAGRRIAGWFVPETRFRLALRNIGLRVSLWPLASALIRHRLAAESVFPA